MIGRRSLLLLGLGLFLLVGGAAAAVILPGSGWLLPPAVWATPVEVEFPAPSLTLMDINGQAVRLGALNGRVALLNNWATWCPPCKAEMPALQTYYQAHKEQGFVLIGVNQSDPASDVRQFVFQYELTFPIWLDPQNQALTAFANQNLPNSYVIDRQGVVRLAWTGPVNRDILEKYLTPLLEAK